VGSTVDLEPVCEKRVLTVNRLVRVIPRPMGLNVPVKELVMVGQRLEPDVAPFQRLYALSVFHQSQHEFVLWIVS
jgi:hypothetical protein